MTEKHPFQGTHLANFNRFHSSCAFKMGTTSQLSRFALEGDDGLRLWRVNMLKSQKQSIICSAIMSTVFKLNFRWHFLGKRLARNEQFSLQKVAGTSWMGSGRNAAKCLHKDIFKRRSQQSHRHDVIFALASCNFGDPNIQANDFLFKVSSLHFPFCSWNTLHAIRTKNLNLYLRFNFWRQPTQPQYPTSHHSPGTRATQYKLGSIKVDLITPSKAISIHAYPNHWGRAWALYTKDLTKLRLFEELILSTACGWFGAVGLDQETELGNGEPPQCFFFYATIEVKKKHILERKQSSWFRTYFSSQNCDKMIGDLFQLYKSTYNIWLPRLTRILSLSVPWETFQFQNNATKL